MSFEVEVYCPKCSKPRNDDGWNQCTCVLDERISELEKLVASRCECENAQTVIVQAERIRTLEAALREIAEHPHNSDTTHNNGIEHTRGHRCAAEIARKALAK